jgi:membrane protein implicated in regulation of membrane protease activity
MEAWWEGLTLLNKGFAVAALFFSVLFVWQFLGALLGLHADSHGDAGHAIGIHHHDFDRHADQHDRDGVGFTLISVRSVLAFGTLFSWAGTLYLMSGAGVVLAMIYSIAWGIAAMFIVSYLVFKLVQLQETGTATVWSAIGEEGVVYLNFPAGGSGKVRVMVSGVISYVNARSRGGESLTAGTKVRVVGVIDDNTIEVEPITEEGAN